MNNINWSEVIRSMTRRRLEIFAINCIGLCMSCDPYTDKNPQEMFDLIFAMHDDTEDEYGE